MLVFPLVAGEVNCIGLKNPMQSSGQAAQTICAQQKAIKTTYENWQNKMSGNNVQKRQTEQGQDLDPCLGSLNI